ncbi:helix-turn-helix domain-containing protein [Streptomyces sp. NPDC097617]|uniref:AraC-like ligand-binding domain-containing protein n=1 Tax=Streptomyces sp. NPDC097617 TaxID=3366091 RepID=UPI00382CA327
MPLVLSTAALSAADRTECWHDAVSRTFVPLEVCFQETEPSPGRIVSDQIGALHVTRVEAGPQMVTRNQRLVARAGEEFVILSLQHRGTAMKEQDRRQTLVRPGDFSLSDAARPFRKRVEGQFSFTSFHFHREDLRVREEDLRAVTATAFPGQSGSGALVATYLAAIAREVTGLEEAAGRQFATTALDLVALLINERCGRFTPHAPDVAAANLERVKYHVLRHLSDPDLSPSSVAVAHRFSVRYLHKLFEPEGVTFGEWVRAQRLERCRRDLIGPPPARPGVAAVAHRWGFVSASHFSRVFRTAYGVNPRDWQQYGLSGEGLTTGS